MSFLDIQDLASVAAQTDLAGLVSAWCAESDSLLGALELGIAAALGGLVFRRARP
jgi:hypothetical protein